MLLKDFSNWHGERLAAHLLREESKMGWTTVCIKTKKKKQKTANFIIKTEKKHKHIFLSDCKSVYKCTACGCVRGCVIGKVYQHLNYCEEIFQIRALMKAHVRWISLPSEVLLQ